MKVTSTAIKNGHFEDKYGKRGSQFNENGVPSLSIPFSITDAPNGTKSFALILEDMDAHPVSGGFAWIHWVAANITRTEIAENESISAKDFVQGINSWASPLGNSQSKELSSFYGGMAPPNAPHTYELHIFALDKVLELENGFYTNDLHWAMEGHILEKFTLKGIYNN